MTVVEAHVAEEHWATLQDAYAAGLQQLGPGIIQTFLVHRLSDATVWQIITLWASREALMAMRRPGQTSPANLIFQAAGAEPAHTVFDIVMQAKAG